MFSKIKKLSISRPGQFILTNGFGFKQYFQKLKHVGSRARSISFTNGFGFFKYFQKLKHVGCAVGSNYFDQLF